MASNKFGNATSDAASLDIQCNENLMLIQLPNVAKALALLKVFYRAFYHRICLVGCKHRAELISLAFNRYSCMLYHYGQLNCYSEKLRHFNR